MKNVIHIYGASGSGTSTLGRKISEELGYKFMDTDDYFWVPANPQYTTKRKREERLALMKEDIIENENVVISGSLVDWGDELIPMFTLVVRLVTDTETKCILSCGNGCSMGNEQALLPSGNSADRLNKTPLMGMQMRKLINIDDLSVIYDELHRCGVLEEYQTADFHKQAKDYVKQAKKIVEGGYQIEKDEEGYYETEISCVRKVAQKQFRCYGIKGHIADPPDGENAKSDWLFYRIDQFPPLEAGDRVRFKTSKSKINAFPDLGRARNIYPDDLKKLD